MQAVAPITPSAPAAAKGAPPPASPGDSPHAFARLLNQADSQGNAAPSQDEADADAKAPADAAHHPAAPARASARPGAAKPAKPDDHAKVPATPGVPADGQPADEAAAATPARPADGAPAAVDPAMLLAALPPRARPLPAPEPGRGPAPAGLEGLPAGGPRGAVDAQAALPTAAGLVDAHDAAARTAAPAAASSFADALREAESKPKAASSPELPTLPPLPQAAPAATAMSASAPAEARIAASPGSPDFATQLGAQLSTFVREGIQHARLELHPVELGPVTVQIQLDGNTAQVNLSAEQAPTRQALEQALPQLAGSLREAGLTLTGGGVFEQPRQPGDGGASAGPRGGRGRGGDAAGRESATFQPVAVARRRGVVDLVA